MAARGLDERFGTNFTEGRGIRSTEERCPACGEDQPDLDWVVVRDTDFILREVRKGHDD